MAELCRAASAPKAGPGEVNADARAHAFPALVDGDVMPRTDTLCGDKTCYRGTVGGWGYQFKDGPCDAPDCQWPKDLKTIGRAR